MYSLTLAKIKRMRSEYLYRKKRRKFIILLLEIRRQRDMARKLGLLPFNYVSIYKYIYIMIGPKVRESIEKFSVNESLFFNDDKNFKEGLLKQAMRGNYYKYDELLVDALNSTYQQYAFNYTFKKILFGKGASL